MGGFGANRQTNLCIRKGLETDLSGDNKINETKNRFAGVVKAYQIYKGNSEQIQIETHYEVLLFIYSSNAEY